LTDAIFILEEVFQLLRESLQQDPFSVRATKKHITRLREILGLEFSLTLSESGNIFYAALTTANKHAHAEFVTVPNNPNTVMQKYETLLLTSFNIMRFGLHSNQTNRSLLQLVSLTNPRNTELIEMTLISLQKSCQSDCRTAITSKNHE